MNRFVFKEVTADDGVAVASSRTRAAGCGAGAAGGGAGEAGGGEAAAAGGRAGAVGGGAGAVGSGEAGAAGGGAAASGGAAAAGGGGAGDAVGALCQEPGDLVYGLVVTYKRSGSTLSGAIFHNNPHVHYVHEPMHAFRSVVDAPRGAGDQLRETQLAEK